MRSKIQLVPFFLLCVFLTGCSRAQDFARSNCERYTQNLEDPLVMKRLEEWYQTLPDIFDKNYLSRGSNRFPGVGTHSIEMGFNPASIGLSDRAEARISVSKNGSLSGLFLTDVRGVMYYFRTDDNVDHFESVTEKHPRGSRVGVMCLRDSY